jgi:glycosyltransferase involved in cell wall biosynthesis
MTRIAIVTPHVTDHDAVCNDVFGMHDALTKRGLETRIYGSTWAISNEDLRIWPVSEIGKFLSSPEDILIYHYSMGWKTGKDLLEQLRCRRVIKYHNVTPPEFFFGWSEDYVMVCQAGRDQIGDIARSPCDLYLSDSEYNRFELVAEGASEAKAFVVPPFNRIEQVFGLEPDFEVLDRYRDGKVNLLMVGSLFPNKGHVELIEAFASYYHDYNSNSRLILVGKESEPLARYSSLLREIAGQWLLNGAVVFTGEVNERSLKAYYLVSDIFVTASKHEGFCVPLVESMAMSLPIVAFSSSAIPGTVNNAGLVWDEWDSQLVAESIDTLMNDESIRSRLAHQGRNRYEQLFRNDQIEQRFLNALGGVL